MDIVSIISFSYGLLKDGYSYIRKNFLPYPPIEKLRIRNERKLEFDKYLSVYKKRAVGCPEVIIRDISRMDNYPEIDDRAKGISPWFKVELNDVYLNRGIEVFLWIECIKDVDDKGYVWADCKDESSITVFLIGRILFETIESVDWDGDENYNMPHIYCRFSKKNGPYSELVYSEKIEGYSKDYFHEIAKYEDVKNLSKKMKVERIY